MGKIKRILNKKSYILLLLTIVLSSCSYNKPIINNYIHEDDSSIFNIINNKKQGIYLFYFPECPWCKEILPDLKYQSTLRKTNIWIDNIHNKNFSKIDKTNLKILINKNTDESDVIVPFIIAINKSKQTQYKIGLIPSNDKNNRKEKIKNEIYSLIKWVRK